VYGPTGAPLAGAYVIGLGNLDVAKTNSAGRYTMNCANQALVAANWLLPVGLDQSGLIQPGVNVTDAQAQPTAPGPGYIFSGGGNDMTTAVVPPCNGTAYNFHLPAGASAVITWNGGATPGTTTTTSADGPIDNLYLPGLAAGGDFETEALNADGQQVLTQLGSGDLRIDGVSSDFSCTSAAKITGNDSAIVYVPLTAGHTVDISCDTETLPQTP
jgi:hypothetical protein